MTNLEVCQKAGPPATIKEVTQFLLFAPEKAVAMRAELRAIKKAGLAAEVYERKMEEQRLLQEQICDLSVKLGEIAKSMPAAHGGDRRSSDFQSASAGKLKSKEETFRELGFSKSQIHRFETLADNRDLVELEKVKAREEGRIPTRTNVIDMAQARKKLYSNDMARIDTDGKYAQSFVHAVHAPLTIADNLDDVASAIWRNSDGNVSEDIRDIDSAIQALQTIKSKLMNGGKLYGRI